MPISRSPADAQAHRDADVRAPADKPKLEVRRDVLMPDLRARETNLRNQIQALDAQLADREAYLALAALYSITSAISLSKTLRDEHEQARLVQRVDEAKLERFLTEHDPFKVA